MFAAYLNKMSGVISAILVTLLAASSSEQSAPTTPYHNVFQDQPTGNDSERWIGIANTSTDSTLHSLWLNVMLDREAKILRDWLSDVTTSDNIDFKVEITKLKTHPEPAIAVKFFVPYKQLNEVSRLYSKRLNGKEVSNADTPQLVIDSSAETTSKSTGELVTVPSTAAGQNIANSHSFKPDPSDNITGVQTTFIVPDNSGLNSESGNSTQQNNNNIKPKPRVDNEQCGNVQNTSPGLVLGGKQTNEGEWPWQIALYRLGTVDNKYICGGTLISHQHVVTAAHCVTWKKSSRVVNKKSLTVYLGRHNLRTYVEGMQIRLVSDIIVHPEHNATSAAKDLGIVKLKEPVEYTDHVRSACLWPENLVDLNHIIGKKGSVVGWGFDETGKVSDELNLVEMPVVDQVTCIRSHCVLFSKVTSDYTYCAGNRNGSSVCNGDSGGGMVFRLGRYWYLRGLVSISVALPNESRCDPNHYVVFTDLAKLLPWIKDQLK